MAILILYATFFASYSEFVYEYYSYFGFPEPSISLSHSIGIIILYLIERLLSRQSMENFFSRIYLYAFVVPGFVYGQSTGYYGLLPSLLIPFPFFLVIHKIPRLRIDNLRMFPMIPLFLTVCVLALTVIVMSIGLGNINYSIKDIYLIRETTDVLYQQEGVQRIAKSLGSAILPATAVLCLHKKYWIGLTGIFGFAVLLFGLNNHKFFLIAPLISIALYVFWNYQKYLPWLISIWNILWLSIYQINETSFYFASLALRRSFFVNIDNLRVYQLFTDQNGFNYWANSILGWEFEYQYSDSLPLVIASKMRSMDSFANTNFIGTGYVNFGEIGVAFHSILLAGIIYLFKSQQHIFGARLSACIGGGAIIGVLLNVDILTGLFTHGLLICLILTWFGRFNENRI